MKSVRTTLQELDSLRKRNRMMLLGWAVVFLAAAAVIFVMKQTGIGLLICFLNLIFYMFYIRREMVRYSDEVALGTIRHGLCRSLQNVECRRKNGFSREQFESWKMLPVYDGKKSFMSRNTFSGESNGKKLSGSEITFHYPVIGTGGRTEFRFLSGVFLTAEGSCEHTGDWLFLRKGLLEEEAGKEFLKTNGYNRCSCLEELEKDFHVYCTDGNAVLPEDVAERIETLRKKSRNPGAVRLTDNGAAVYLDRCFFAGGGYPKTDPTKELLEMNYFLERDEIWRLFRFW